MPDIYKRLKEKEKRKSGGKKRKTKKGKRGNKSKESRKGKKSRKERKSRKGKKIKKMRGVAIYRGSLSMRILPARNQLMIYIVLNLIQDVNR